MGLVISKRVETSGETLLSLVGDCDLGSADALRDTITGILNGNPRTPLTIDLDRVEFLDSTGLSVLLDGTRLAQRLGTRYRVVNSHGIVSRVLEITGLAGRLDT